ncbi:hypothetical protein AB5I41_06675 [Sphingomonas sp. MMS24-JH45]
MILNHSPSVLDAEASRSSWIVMTRDPETFATIQLDGARWRRLRKPKGFQSWTDDYATILPLLKFWDRHPGCHAHLVCKFGVVPGPVRHPDPKRAASVTLDVGTSPA